jgi:hypothetical protein
MKSRPSNLKKYEKLLLDVYRISNVKRYCIYMHILMELVGVDNGFQTSDSFVVSSLEEGRMLFHEKMRVPYTGAIVYISSVVK